jgi:hypothetical protein
MYFKFTDLSLVAASLVLIGCGGGGTSSDASTGGVVASGNTSSTKNITITDDYQVESLGLTNTISATVNLGNTPKSLYILLSNYHETQSASSSITHNKIVSIQKNKKVFEAPLDKHAKTLHAHALIQEFNKNSKKFFKTNTASSQKIQAKTVALSTVSKKDAIGDSQIFYMEVDTSVSTQATARKVVSNISTPFGLKTLNIWVSNDSFSLTDDSGCPKTKCVTQTMVDALASTFLQAGADNDIYDWVTNIYGEEWNSAAQSKYSNLISANDEITILLTDIPNPTLPTYDTTDGGVIGFFYSKDNFTDISGSNQRVMFYADAVLFANSDSATWSIDDFWPKEMVSTLAHEFQHMIHYYQKEVLLLPQNTLTDTWINEMLAETTEDLIATKISHTGPRGVDPLDGSAGNTGNRQGRYPLFNQNNALSLTELHGRDRNGNPTMSLADYSKVNAFGAYLVRNYGGAKVLHDIMHNAFEDENAVVDGVTKSVQGSGKTFNMLLKEWGVAVLLSDNENLQNQPAYNTGDFTQDTYDGSINSSSTYELGSINFFNYSPTPTIFTSAGTVAAQGNYYYKVGDNLTGTVTIDLTLNGTTEATLIAK